MYWVCFGDGAKGGLAMARRAMEPTLDEGHILALADDWAQGDIADVTDRAARSDILTPWRGDPELDGAWREKYRARHWAALEQLDEADEVVIWYAGGNPCGQCGLRYVVSRLRQRHIPVWVCEVGWMPVSAIQRANRRMRDTSVVGVITSSRAANALLRLVPQPLLRRYAARVERRSLRKRMEQSPRAGMAYFSTVGEVSPDLLAYFYQRRRLLTDGEQDALAADWARLRRENTPLRTLVDGSVQSVPADYYDDVILSCVPEEEDCAALTVGRSIIALDKTGNRVSDMLVFARIRALGAAGRLAVVRDGATYRDMTIRKIHA